MEGVAAVKRNTDANVHRQFAIQINIDATVSIDFISISTGTQAGVVVYNRQQAVIKGQRVKGEAAKIYDVLSVRSVCGLILVILLTFNLNQRLCHHQAATLERRITIQAYADKDVGFGAILIQDSHTGSGRTGVSVSTGILCSIVVFNGQSTVVEGQNVQTVHQEVDVIGSIQIATNLRSFCFDVGNGKCRHIVPAEGAKGAIQIERNGSNTVTVGVSQLAACIQVIVRTRPAGVIVIHDSKGTCSTVCRDRIERKLIYGNTKESNLVLTVKNVGNVKFRQFHRYNGQRCRNFGIFLGGNGDHEAANLSGVQRVGAITIIGQSCTGHTVSKGCGEGAVSVCVDACAEDNICRTVVININGVLALIGINAVFADRRIDLGYRRSGDLNSNRSGRLCRFDRQGVGSLSAADQHNRAIPVGNRTAIIGNLNIVQCNDRRFGTHAGETHRERLACLKGNSIVQRPFTQNRFAANPRALIIVNILVANLLIQPVICHEYGLGVVLEGQIALAARLLNVVVIYRVGNEVGGVIGRTVFIRLAVILGRSNVSILVGIILAQSEGNLNLIQSLYCISIHDGLGEGKDVDGHALVADDELGQISIGICFCPLVKTGDQGRDTVESILGIVIVSENLRESIAVDQSAGRLVRLTYRAVGIFLNTEHCALVEHVPIVYLLVIVQIFLGDHRAVSAQQIVDLYLILGPSIILEINVSAVNQAVIVFAHFHSLIDRDGSLDKAANGAKSHIVVVVSLFVLNNAVTTLCRMPVVIRVHRPCLGNEAVLVTAVVCANVARAIVIGVGVRCLILHVDGASAANGVPVAALVRGKFGCIGMGMVIVISANVTDAVLVRICVCCYGNLGGGTILAVLAGCRVPVTILVHRPDVTEGVLVCVSNRSVVVASNEQHRCQQQSAYQ